LEDPQTFSFPLPKGESKVLPVISAAKIAIEIFFLCDQVVDVGQVLIAQFA
jgi:hypothetical protein